MTTSMRKEAFLRRLIKFADRFFDTGINWIAFVVAMGDLILRAFTDEDPSLFGTGWHAVLMACCVLIVLFVTAMSGSEKTRIAYVDAAEGIFLLAVLTILLPFQVIKSGISSVPDYYYKGAECLTTLRLFR